MNIKLYLYYVIYHLCLGNTRKYYKNKYRKIKEIALSLALSPQKQRAKSLIFVHSVNFKNTGDSNCAPYRYFVEFSKYNFSIMDIQSPLIDTIEKDDIVIVGGGGLMNFNETWNHQINVILEKSDNVIGWGLGFNTHYDYEEPREKINFDRFRYITNRDYLHPMNLPYLPCVSCMMESLEKRYEIKREIGIVEHQNFPIPLDFAKVNNMMDILEVAKLL